MRVVVEGHSGDRLCRWQRDHGPSYLVLRQQLCFQQDLQVSAGLSVRCSSLRLHGQLYRNAEVQRRDVGKSQGWLERSECSSR